MPINVVLTQHAEEAAFLWLLRDDAVLTPHYDPPSLARLDDRVEAHLDGLRVAGETGCLCAKAQLDENQEPGEVFAFASIAFHLGDQSHIKEALDVAVGSAELARPVSSALAWLDDDRAMIQSIALMSQPDPAVRRMGLAGAAVRRMNPGRPLNSALADPDVPLLARALRAVGELGLTDRLPIVKRHLNHPDLTARWSAAWSIARLTKEPAAVAELQAIAVTETSRRRQSAELAARCLTPADAQAWMRVLAKLPNCRRIELHVAGAFGDPAAVPRLIEQMAVPELARVAGEAFSMITGVHVSYDDLECEPPEDFEAGPTENPDDDRVDMDPDDGLPWPDPDKVRKWWEANQSHFARGTRHLIGRPITPEWCREVLRAGYQRQRAAAAMELALRNPDEPLLEVRAPGFRK